MSNIVIKRDGTTEEYSVSKVQKAVRKAFKSCKKSMPRQFSTELKTLFSESSGRKIKIEEIQEAIEKLLGNYEYFDVLRAFTVYRKERERIRTFVSQKENFIEKYKNSDNTANATVDDNSNVGSRNIGVLNSEIHKEDNIQISRGMITDKLKSIFPDFDAKQYIRDLNHHIIYKHDESSFGGALAPYCCSISMYPFINNGLKNIGGLSAAPKNLDSYCGMLVNLIFATSAQFAGAVAVSEALLYFDYYARKEWGNDYYVNADDKTARMKYDEGREVPVSVHKQIHQYFQQIVYSINQPAAARGLQSAFVNFSYFDKPFFEGMFGNFYFPDDSRPIWESVSWLQKDFMMWFNEERLKCMLTFPVESVTLLYKDGKFEDGEMFEFVCEEYARGHSFFTYISDSVDSLSSCCRLKNKLQTKEFNFTNGNIGVMTGSKSVITLNLSRLVQDWSMLYMKGNDELCDGPDLYAFYSAETGFTNYLNNVLERVYKYHVAYNELLWDMYDAKLLPVYSAGFIALDKQYLTIGINGLNQAAEFMKIKCSDNTDYQKFCQTIFGAIKDFNSAHNGKFNGHKITLNTECVPAESLAIKNYNWDKEDGYWVPDDTNLYASYVFKPNDESTSVLDKVRMHGSNYIGDYLDGGSAAHINLSEHLSKAQYEHLLKYAAEEGCSYITFNIPNCECQDCGFIAKQPFGKCPKCGSENVALYDRIIGYLTKVKNWSAGRQAEQNTRVYAKMD